MEKTSEGEKEGVNGKERAHRAVFRLLYSDTFTNQKRRARVEREECVHLVRRRVSCEEPQNRLRLHKNCVHDPYTMHLHQ